MPSIKEVLCSTCGTHLASKKGLARHVCGCGPKRSKRSQLCDVCGIAFNDKESLKAHTFRTHLPREARKFKCDFDGCRYCCLYHHQLLEHQKVHSDDKPYACDQCQYTAKSKWTFKKHYRKHTKEKPFSCPHCSYASGLSSNLTRHLRIHTGSKPFKCPYCAYSCNNHENLRKHVLNTKKHKGLYLYNCTHCDYGTNVFTELRKHMEERHSDIYTTDQIDRMISSIYHKQEDNTTVVADSQIKSEDSDETNADDSQPFNCKHDMQQMIVIHQNHCEELIVPTAIDDTQTIFLTSTHSIQYDNNSNPNDNRVLINNNSIHGSSEVIIIDSDVLEAEEICVSEQTAGNNNSHIVIAISK